ncbi:hypothetical protein AKJ50_01055 [candidate division MSBL1 archaeon SCGC-AAA382A13]|uniref:Histidine kinase n=1 Tax=candidate division MSBL1 archaeon SCGC-AAA382A13 TaxID=1698279 RepID=A0A133VG20_9EURY|nr:hypothetical protein AKJ50_01055 [candidate division MSBL1 archaeon SCGC-AAA382A13]
MEVLMVDDEPGLLEQAKSFLEKENERLKIRISTSAKKALKLLEREECDCVVSDYQMPEMNGLDFLETVRGKRNSDIPFIMFTGKSREEVAIKALNFGANRYIRKGGSPKSQYGVLADAIIQEVKRVKSKQKLSENKKKFKQLFEMNPVPTHLFNKEGELVEVNQSACQTLGYEKKELLGKNIFEIPFLTEEAQNKIIGFFQDYVNKNLDEENGSPPIEPEIIEVETKKGKSRIGEVKAKPIKNNGKISGVIGVVRDITDHRKRREKEKFLHSLLRHDVQNKTQIIHGYLQILAEKDLPDKQKKSVEKALNACKESISVIEKVKTLREVNREEEVGEVNIGSVIKNVVSEKEPQASEKGIRIEYEDCGYNVMGGPLLDELFSNLIENSIVHSDCEKIRISSEETEEKCIFTLEDDGCGIPQEGRKKIFERGYRKGDTGGSGLGLYLVKEIAESYEGRVEVENSELGGAKVDVYLRKT